MVPHLKTVQSITAAVDKKEAKAGKRAGTGALAEDAQEANSEKGEGEGEESSGGEPDEEMEEASSSESENAFAKRRKGESATASKSSVKPKAKSKPKVDKAASTTQETDDFKAFGSASSAGKQDSGSTQFMLESPGKRLRSKQPSELFDAAPSCAGGAARSVRGGSVAGHSQSGRSDGGKSDGGETSITTASSIVLLSNGVQKLKRPSYFDWTAVLTGRADGNARHGVLNPADA